MMPDKKLKVAILGANGRLGRTAADAFARAGFEVIAITRSGHTDLAGATGVACNAMVESEVIAATRGADFIFNGLNPRYDQWAAMVMPIARNVMAAAKASGATHIFPGNVYNYGTQIPQSPDETTPFIGDHRKAAIRIEAETLFETAAREHGVQTLILRAGDFFGGTGTGSWFDMAIAANAAKGKMTYPGPRDLIHAWAYLPDLAQAFVALANKAETLPVFARFNFGGHNVTGETMKASMEKALGRRLSVAGLPWPLLRIGGLFYPMWRELWEMRYLWTLPHQLSGEKLISVVGPLSQTPFDDAVSKALQDLGITIVPSGKIPD